MALFIIIPIDETFEVDEQLSTEEDVVEAGDLAVFQSDKTYEEAEEIMGMLCRRGKVPTYIILEKEMLDDKLPNLNELLAFSLQEDLNLDY